MSIDFSSLPRWKRRFETASVGLTMYSMGVFFAELEFGNTDRSEGWWLWNERLLAILFTAEYLFRWAVSHERKGHPLRPMAVIDLISILPFWVGFFVPPQHLGMIRAFRVLRILRLYRYTDGFNHVRQAFHRCRSEMEVVLLFLSVVCLFTSVVFFQAEHTAQPDKVAKLSDALWWCVVTVATVGYGDIAPITAAGRAVSVFAILAGTACYGVLMTLFGGAWIDVLREMREKKRQEQLIEEEP